jgi:DNA repair exonuclease SbcCD ATPase subunit
VLSVLAACAYVSEVKPARYLGGSAVDPEREAEMRAQEEEIAKAIAELKSIDEERQKLQQAFETYAAAHRKAHEEASTAIAQLSQQLQQRKVCTTAITNCRTKIRQLEQEVNDQTQKESVARAVQLISRSDSG